MATVLDEFYIRLYLSYEQDETLARHLSRFDSRKGAKHDEAKRLMWLGLQVETGESSPDLDSDIVRRAVQEAMQDTADNKHPIEETGVQECERLSTEALASIRRVVDAALQQHLDRLRINGSVQCEGNEGQNKSQNEDGDDEDDDEAARVDALMDTLGKSLLR